MNAITPRKDKLGFIGIGYTGRPIAQRLLDAGFQLTAYDWDRTKAEELIQYGGCVSPKFYPRRKWRVSPCATAGRVCTRPRIALRSAKALLGGNVRMRRIYYRCSSSQGRTQRVRSLIRRIIRCARERHEVKGSGYSYRRCLQGITPRERQAETVLPVECLLASNRMHFSEGLPKLAQSTFALCSPIGSPTSRGFCTVKRRRFNDFGEMKACLQSRCSPS
jgi:hypothetical protein